MNDSRSVNRESLKWEPWDPFGRFGDGHLIKLVLEAVESVDGLIPVSSRPHFKPVQMVTLLTYCYARGIFSSEEIEIRLSRDKAIACICAGVKPDWHLLRRFRRQHVFLLVETLAQLFKRVAPLDSRPGGRGTDCWPRTHEAAKCRLRQAIQADSIALDA